MSLSLKEIIERVPREVREKTAARGGFPKYGSGGYACADGMCIMAALITDLHGERFDKSFPGPHTALRQLMPLLPELNTETYGPEEEQAYRQIRRLMDMNDEGELATPEAVRAALYLDEEGA